MIDEIKDKLVFVKASLADERNENAILKDRIALAIKYLTDEWKAPEMKRQLALEALRGEI